MKSRRLALETKGCGIPTVYSRMKWLIAAWRSPAESKAYCFPCVGQVWKKVLNGIVPRGRGRRYVEGPVRMMGAPDAHLISLVPRLFVEEKVVVLVGCASRLMRLRKQMKL